MIGTSDGKTYDSMYDLLMGSEKLAANGQDTKQAPVQDSYHSQDPVGQQYFAPKITPDQSFNSMMSFTREMGQHADWDKFMATARPSTNIEDVRNKPELQKFLEHAKAQWNTFWHGDSNFGAQPVMDETNDEGVGTEGEIKNMKYGIPAAGAGAGKANVPWLANQHPTEHGKGMGITDPEDIQDALSDAGDSPLDFSIYSPEDQIDVRDLRQGINNFLLQNINKK